MTRTTIVALVLALVPACSSPESARIVPDPASDAGPSSVEDVPEGDAGPVAIDAGPRPVAADGGAPGEAPSTSTARCDTPVDGTQYVAMQAYPGRSAAELARVRALIPLSSGSNPVLASKFAFTTGVLFVGPGVVGVFCARDATVTFVGP